MTSTEVYCLLTEVVHSTGEVCSGFHIEWWKAPQWVNFNGLRICARCSYINQCKCMWCGRCNKVTGNNTQGHFWAYCKVTSTIRDFHFCCPDDCELETV